MTLIDNANTALRQVRGTRRSKDSKGVQKAANLGRLEAVKQSLGDEVDTLQAKIDGGLAEDESTELTEIDSEIVRDQTLDQATNERDALNVTFTELRNENKGRYPRNISPVFYVIPLILLGMAEWYVNYSTLAADLIPAVAIAGTVILALVFAGASHYHGAFLKQMADILSPSNKYNNVLGVIDRKVMLAMMTVFLLAAFTIIIWLRYNVISEQLGLNSSARSNVFVSESETSVWSFLLPTILLNFSIWGLGTFYSWIMHERVPGLREIYRDLIRSREKVVRLTKPYDRRIDSIKSNYKKIAQSASTSLDQHQAALREVNSMLKELAPGADKA